MFGYVRPFVPSLRVREHELYRGIYCGLCFALGRKYGVAARFLVNYDLCFLALLLWEGPLCPRKRRCAAHPFRKRTVCCHTAGEEIPPALSLAADATVLVSAWKLEDTRRDARFPARFAAAFALWLLRKPRRLAERALPGVVETAERVLGRLGRLEQEGESSLDAPADCFAELLRAFSRYAGDEARCRTAAALLYQLGRWIYIADAADDLKEDCKRGTYNPLCRRFGLTEGWTEEALEKTRATLSFSRESILRAAALWPENACTPLWRNVLEEGLPAAEERILAKQPGAMADTRANH